MDIIGDWFPTSVDSSIKQSSLTISVQQREVRPYHRLEQNGKLLFDWLSILLRTKLRHWLLSRSVFKLHTSISVAGALVRTLKPDHELLCLNAIAYAATYEPCELISTPIGGHARISLRELRLVKLQLLLPLILLGRVAYTGLQPCINCICPQTSMFSTRAPT